MRTRWLLALALAAPVAGCGTSAGGGGGRLRVVAAENFWGSLATQLAGNRAAVASIITNPSTDPHSYEPTAGDARTVATARLAIVNGIGYDSWAPKLLAASPSAGRVVLDVGDLLGLHDGDNPHQWYSPPHVEQVIAAITAALQKLKPADAGYFRARRAALESQGLARYHALIAQIGTRYKGTPVGASESIFAAMAPALGLKLVTPPGFMKAISEGTDPAAADKATADAQITGHRIKVWVYNSQNSTPDVQRLTEEARRAGIQVTTVTETLVPASTSFQHWQAAELVDLQRALARATGR